MVNLKKKEYLGREISILYVVKGVSLPFTGICLWKKKKTICLFTKKGGIDVILKVLISNIISLQFKDIKEVDKLKVANLYKRYLNN